jgi:predicted dehydrogenase
MSKQDPSCDSSRPSRREFLKRSSAAIGAAAVGTLAVARGAHAAGSDVLKVGLIGCGGRGTGAARQALDADPNTRLVALADVFENKVLNSRELLRKALANDNPEQVAVDDDHCFVGFDAYRKVIASSDVVLIACASRFHPQYLKAAVDAGKHVFVEKPHGVDAPGVRLTIEACEEARKKNLAVVSGLCWRYDPCVRETMKRVLDGAVGRIVAIEETYMRTPYHLQDRDPQWDEMHWQMQNWYHFNWLSGDDICQSLVHCLDKASWVLGDEPPVAAFGSGGRSSCFEGKFGDQFDHFNVAYEYADGTMVYGFGRAQHGCFNQTADHILGTKGRCNVIKGKIEGETNWEYDGRKVNMYDSEHQELFASIRAGTPINNGRYMATSTMLGILGRMVCYTGKKLTWEDAMNSQQKLGPDEVAWTTTPPVAPEANGQYPAPVPGLTELA